MAVRMERATPDDFEWCAKMMAGSEPWVTLGDSIEKRRKTLQRPGTELFVGWEGRDRIGCLLLAPYGMAGSPYVASIGVAEKHRGKGAGKELMDFAEKHFAGREHIFLLVSSFNDKAQKFYQRLGYQKVGEIADYIVRGSSELIYHKRLQ